MLTIIRASAPKCRTLFLISAIDTNYVPPAVISYVLFSGSSTIIEQLSAKNSCCKSSTSTYPHLPINLNLPNLSHRPGDLNNGQLTEIRSVYEHFITLDIPHLLSPWWWVIWTTLIIVDYLMVNAITSTYFCSIFCSLRTSLISHL